MATAQEEVEAETYALVDWHRGGIVAARTKARGKVGDFKTGWLELIRGQPSAHSVNANWVPSSTPFRRQDKTQSMRTDETVSSYLARRRQGEPLEISIFPNTPPPDAEPAIVGYIWAMTIESLLGQPSHLSMEHKKRQSCRFRPSLSLTALPLDN
ncbi:uncharacterized protein FFB14_15281 [Fusarium fujikuroi]|nr:uncharacterized protein FFB14_15281 [Fusarium fujikuroi]